jgi:cobalt-zinc-cadmium efflux system membrane fusion protein
MKTNKAWILPLLVGVLALGGVAWLYLKPSPVHKEEPAASAPDTSGRVAFLMEQQWLIKMKLALGEEASVAPQILSTGRVVPVPGNRAVISSPVGGTLANERLPRIGQDVSAGQLLVTVSQTSTAAESAQMRVENVRLEAERRRLSQAVNESRVRMNLAKTEFDRATRLYEQKAYSQRQLQAAEADFKAAEAAVASVTGQLDALASPAAASTTYSVRAPIAGTIVEVRKAIGEQVQPGEVILEIVNLDRVWIEAPVFERDIARLRPQTRAVFSTVSVPDEESTGTLVNIGAVVDEKTRAITAVFEAANPGRRFRIGMQANVRIDSAEQVQAILIPKEAVLDHEGKRIVYVLITGEEFQRVEVTVGNEYGGKVAILSGLKPGQRVVTQGAYQLKLQELRPANAGEHSHEV